MEKGYFHPYAAGRNLELFNKIFNNVRSIDDVSVDFNTRADEKDHPIHSIVLSEEDICSRRDLSLLAGFTDHFDVKIVLVMRRQDLWIESWYQQNVKWQWNPELSHLPFAEFTARRKDFFWIDYDTMVTSLEAMFGPGNVECLVFEGSEMPDGPVAAFCKAIGLTDLEGFKPAPWVNTSMSPMMTEFMRNLPLDEIVAPDRSIIEQACMAADKEVRATSRKQFGKAVGQPRGKSPTLFMDAETRATVLTEYADGNAALARRKFDRDTLFRDPLPAADAPIAPQELPQNSYQTMEDLVAPFIRALALRLTADRLDGLLNKPKKVGETHTK